MTESNPSIVLASRNVKKSAEIRELLAPHGIDVLSVADFPEVGEVVEDGDTFAANAAKKAREPALQLKRWVLAEDSGLMVDALGGDPGVYSARYSGENATDEENNAKLIAALEETPNDRRGAQYVCHAALSDANGEIQLCVEATCRGRITREPQGDNGFGYDPYFMIPEYHKTFGQLDPIVKQHLSHRARAFERLIPPLVQLLKGSTD